MKRSRRRFLQYAGALTAATVAAGGWWLGTSSRRPARWVRRIVADARRKVAPAPVTPDPAKWSDNQVTICWIGHSTVLINFYGIKILTDPVFGNCVGVSLGIGTAGPKRYIAPALQIKNLPPIDVVLLSHAHMDHMDLPSLGRLDARLTITAGNTADILGSSENVAELSWGEHTLYRAKAGELLVEAFEVKHWGQRWPSEKERGYNGYVLRREGKAILFGGDTAQTKLFAELRSKGPFEAAIMPIGAYQPWIRSHCTPEQAVEMANATGAKYIIPVHHQTFKLSYEPMNEPIERLEQALAKEPERIALRKVGESFTC
ncbi:MAG: MBL fold metallo-hydrolase [Verrucomicrobia subdivision 3 bacterium]|nr:MBL fold metallo-hydrolase [Limisphaerales bacterium]